MEIKVMLHILPWKVEIYCILCITTYIFLTKLMAVDQITALVDSLLTRLSSQNIAKQNGVLLNTSIVKTPVGNVRVLDSGEHDKKPCVIFVPDGPNLIEHYEALITLLQPTLRVVCFDMPGFGFSVPNAKYTHSLDHGAHAVLGVMDELNIQKATLCFSCANGFYALRAAQLAPQRITQLILSQTPSLDDMHAWVNRIIPWPVKIPVIGQILTWLTRKKLAFRWYPSALPRTTDATAFQEKTSHAMACGSSFCLAGVVQGLIKEKPASLQNIDIACTVIWGCLDRSHKPTIPSSLLTAIPNAELIEFADCGHFPEIEQPERYAALLLARVNKLGR
jgi:pimeloyl-ACP methyl ester carboxylesterase